MREVVGALHLGRMHILKKSMLVLATVGCTAGHLGGKKNHRLKKRQINFKRIRRKRRRLGRPSASAAGCYRMCIYVKFILVTLESEAYVDRG